MTRGVKAPHGERTIALTVRFWTDGIAEGEGIAPRECWEYGTVRFQVNRAHGIGDHDWTHFDSLDDLVSQVREAARKAGVKFKRSK